MLESGWYILGTNVATFEREFAAYLNRSYCVGVASRLDALILALKTFNLPPESEVIVPSNTYIATILAIAQNGLKPVLVEPAGRGCRWGAVHEYWFRCCGRSGGNRPVSGAIHAVGLGGRRASE